MMKKMILIAMTMLIASKLFAPADHHMMIFAGEPIESYDVLIRAIVSVESGGNDLAYNPKENAVGAFQIRQCRVDDFNRQTGKKYSLEDMFDYEISKEVFLYFAQKQNSWESIARSWNGSGEMTKTYWEKVKANL